MKVLRPIIKQSSTLLPEAAFLLSAVLVISNHIWQPPPWNSSRIVILQLVVILYKTSCKINCVLACYAKKPSLPINTNKIGSPWHVHCDTSPSHLNTAQLTSADNKLLLSWHSDMVHASTMGISMEFLAVMFDCYEVDQNALNNMVCKPNAIVAAISGHVSSKIAMHDHSCAGHLHDPWPEPAQEWTQAAWSSWEYDRSFWIPRKRSKYPRLIWTNIINTYPYLGSSILHGEITSKWDQNRNRWLIQSEW